METSAFLKDFLPPSRDFLSPAFTVPLPAVPGLKQTASFIVQGQCHDTYSTNIVKKHENDAGVRLVEVYKNTQDLTKGIFVRLVGTMSLVKCGYPFLFLDAAVSNLNLLTAQQEALATRIAVHLPQAAPDARSCIFDLLSDGAQSRHHVPALRSVPGLPPFWGPLWSVRAEGLDTALIGALREIAWQGYAESCTRHEPDPSFDYRPMQRQMVFVNSVAEQGLFRKMGLAVPAEAQAAFFSILAFAHKPDIEKAGDCAT